MFIEIIVDRDYVLIAGTKVQRPVGTGIQQWLEFWEDIVEHINESNRVRY